MTEETKVVMTNIKPDEILPIDRNPAAVYLATLRATGRRTMHQALNQIAGLASNGQMDALSFPWHKLRFQHTNVIKSALVEKGLAPATINKHLVAMRQALHYAAQLELMSYEDYHRAAGVKPVKATKLPRGRALVRDELGQLMAVCAEDKTIAGRRDAAMIAILHSTGLRRSELVGLEMGSYSAVTNALIIRNGKGNKDRLAYLNTGASAALSAWLAVRGTEAGALFWRVNKGGKIELKPLTDQAVRVVLKKRGLQAGVELFTPHDLRRTFVGDMLDVGVDLVTVQQLAGHASPQTTARYDRRGEKTKQKAIRLLDTPFN